MARILVALLTGILVAFATVWLVELLGHEVYPVPSDLALDNPEQAGRYGTDTPIGAQLFVVAAWFLGALFGGGVAARIACASWPAWLIGVLVAVAAVATIFWIPHPELMQIAVVAAPLVGGVVASHFLAGLGTGRRSNA